jgi:hypothetical protein
MPQNFVELRDGMPNGRVKAGWTDRWAGAARCVSLFCQMPAAGWWAGQSVEPVKQHRAAELARRICCRSCMRRRRRAGAGRRLREGEELWGGGGKQHHQVGLLLDRHQHCGNSVMTCIHPQRDKKHGSAPLDRNCENFRGLRWPPWAEWQRNKTKSGFLLRESVFQPF